MNFSHLFSNWTPHFVSFKFLNQNAVFNWGLRSGVCFDLCDVCLCLAAEKMEASKGESVWIFKLDFRLQLVYVIALFLIRVKLYEFLAAY